jgi:hypothetical protein
MVELMDGHIDGPVDGKAEEVLEPAVGFAMI